MTKNEVLQQCTVEGNVVRLPDVKLDRNTYLEVAKALELIGGKWKGGKVGGFVFQDDPTERLSVLSEGGHINLKKEYQFFATPDGLADELVDYAFNTSGITADDVKNGDVTILEPSAGQGAIISAIYRYFDTEVPVTAYELMPMNREILTKEYPQATLGGQDDFLQSDPSVKYDFIIANPPFSKNQDIDHFKAMYDRLKDCGRLVCVTSNSWVHGSQKKQTEFRSWLEEIEADIYPIHEGAFKTSGTMVGGKLIIVEKR